MNFSILQKVLPTLKTSPSTIKGEHLVFLNMPCEEKWSVIWKYKFSINITSLMQCLKKTNESLSIMV